MESRNQLWRFLHIGNKSQQKTLKGDLDQVEFGYKANIGEIYRYLGDKLIREEARKQNTSEENLLNKLFENGIKKPTDDEINALLKKYPRLATRENAKNSLVLEKKYIVQQEYTDRLLSKEKIKILLEKPPAFPLVGICVDPTTTGKDLIVAEVNGKPVKASEALTEIMKGNYWREDGPFFSCSV